MPTGIYIRTKIHGLNLSKGHKGQIPWNEGLTSLTNNNILSGEKHPRWGKYATKESKEKSRIAHLGKIPWNKGERTGKMMNCFVCNKEFYVVLSKAGERKYCSFLCSTKDRPKGENSFFYGKHLSEEHRIKISDGNKGRKLSQKTKDKIGRANKGNLPWTAGKHHSQKTKDKISEALKSSEKYKLAMIEVRKKMNYKPTKETIKKCLTRRIPSSLEEKFLDIAKRHNLPYKYVGNGRFFIDRFNPDFINTNSEKIAVEVYARYYKKRNHISIDKWKNERAKVFREYGWKLLFFNEVELNDDNVLVALSANSRDIGDEEVT